MGLVKNIVINGRLNKSKKSKSRIEKGDFIFERLESQKIVKTSDSIEVPFFLTDRVLSTSL